MSKWPMKSLGQVCEINPRLPKNHGITDDSEVSFVPMASVDELLGRIANQQIRTFAEVKKGYTPFKDDDVLFAKITPCMENGKAFVACNLTGGIGFGSTEFHVFRSRGEVIPEWIFYFIRRQQFRNEAKRNFTGTAGQQRVPTTFIEAAQIPVPPIVKQRNIVDILSRAEGIVRLRREAQKKAAEIIPALFIDMFGDPATNPKRWTESRLGDLALKMSDGPFGSNLKTAHYTEAGIRVIRLQNIGIGVFKDEDCAYVSPEHYASLPRNHCEASDVIIATLGDPNLRAMVLPTHIPEALNKADCVQFRCNLEIVVPEFICWLMNMPSVLGMAASMVQGITRSRISMGRLRELYVPVPPIELQRKFSERVSQISSIQTQQASAIQKAEENFNVLLARFFQ